MANVAELYKRRLPRQQMLIKLRKHFHPELTTEEVEHRYYGPLGGSRPNFDKLFPGKTPEEIDAELRAWHERTKRVRKKQGDVWRGKKRPDISERQLGSKRRLERRPQGKLGVRAKEQMSLRQRGRTLKLSPEQRAARSRRAGVQKP